MSRSRTRRQEIPTETSWRMVEGEHDSFDTSLVPEDQFLDGDIISSGRPSELSNLSQLSQLSGLSSQSNGDWNIGSSQDNSTIQDFISKADDERVIMRSPFQPSVPGAPRRLPRNNANQSPDPEFYMPRVDIDSSRRNSSAGSARTIRPGDAQNQNVRQRRPGAGGRQSNAPQHLFADTAATTSPPPSVGERLSTSLPHALYDILAWGFGVVGMAFRYAQKPLAVALAIYLTVGTLILASNWLTHSLYAAISPVCNIPGMSYVDLPFCPKIPVPPGSGPGADDSKDYVDFDSLVDIQERLPDVLEMSAQSVSLPLEMKRSEASIRDLRTMVRYSELRGKEELLLEFDGFVETARTASGDLQRFNAHVGSAVDSVISINRWTSRYLESLAAAESHRAAGLGSLTSLAADIASWAFAPFRPAIGTGGALLSLSRDDHERRLLASYVEHTALVSDRVAQLIDEATLVLGQLERLDGHLEVIHDWATRTHNDVAGSRDEVLLSLWTLVGANRGRLRGLDAQLRLLARVGSQRRDAARRLVELRVELVRIQGELEELRERVAAPGMGLAAAGPGAGAGVVPLSVHVETINAGVANLEQARTRIRGVENDRIREAMLKGREEDRLIESS